MEQQPLAGSLEDIPLLLKKRLPAPSTSTIALTVHAGVLMSRLSIATPTMCIIWLVLLTAILDIAPNENGHNTDKNFKKSLENKGFICFVPFLGLTV